MRSFVICTLHLILSGWSNKKLRSLGCSHRRTWQCMQNFCWQAYGERVLGKIRHRWKDNTKMHLREIGSKDTKWSDPAQEYRIEGFYDSGNIRTWFYNKDCFSHLSNFQQPLVHSALDAPTESCVSCTWQDKERADKMHTNFSALGRIWAGYVANRGRKAPRFKYRYRIYLPAYF
jgi:hypothetical protein